MSGLNPWVVLNGHRISLLLVGAYRTYTAATVGQSVLELVVDGQTVHVVDVDANIAAYVTQLDSAFGV